MTEQGRYHQRGRDTLRMRRWRSDILLFEQDDETAARVLVETDAGQVYFDASARRGLPVQAGQDGDQDLVVGRALIGVGRKLLGDPPEEPEPPEEPAVQVIK
jgi:hypothetical protein